MKTAVSIFLCMALALVLAAPALTDDAALSEALAAGKTVILTEVGMNLPDGTENAMPVSISPDRRSVIWRTSVNELILVRDGTVIPLSPAPQRGAGDPYGKLVYEVFSLMTQLTGAEALSWSPDSRYLLLTSRTIALKMIQAMDLVVLDAQTGEIYLEQAYEGGSKERGDWLPSLESPDFGTVIEARFDSTGENIWFVGRINAFSETFSLFRYNPARRTTELVLEDIGLSRTGRILYETKDGAWLVMTSSGTSVETCDAVLRVSPSRPGGLSSLPVPASGTDRWQRGFASGKLSVLQAVCSPKSGYGLILTGSPMASQASAQALQTVDAATAAALSSAAFPAIYAVSRLNRLTPDEIALNEYWELTGDPADPASLQVSEADPQLMDMLMRYAHGDALTHEERAMISVTSQRMAANPPPRINCICQSPDGRFALLNVSKDTRGEGSAFCLLDLTDMALYPVQAPDDIGPVLFNTPFVRNFGPGMVWNDDGTLLIGGTGSDAVRAWRLTVEE